MKNFYEILGVSENATFEEIKKAYKKLAVENHPDRGGDQVRMKEINEAWDTLKNEDRRQKYDAERKMAGASGFSPFRKKQPGGMWTDHDINTIFEDIMKSGHPFRTHFGQGFQQVRRNPTTDVKYTITLKQAYTGHSVNAKIRLPDGQERQFQLNIPPGIENGSKIKFAEQGIQKNPNVPPGDVVFHIAVEHVHPPHFHREGGDLYGKLKISAFDAMLGCVTEFTNIDDSKIRINIPSGTQPGAILRIVNHGFPLSDGRTGHLFIILEITIPKNLSEDQLTKIKEIKDNITNG